MITRRRYDYVAIGEIKRRRGRQIILEIVVEITLATFISYTDGAISMTMRFNFQDISPSKHIRVLDRARYTGNYSSSARWF